MSPTDCPCGTELPDVISGAAGIVNVLAQAGGALGLDVENELVALRGQVRDFAAYADDFGFAHGRSGAVAALASIDAELGMQGDEITRLARAVVDNQPRCVDFPVRDSWCKGLPGVVAALAECPGTSMQLSGLAESLMGRECRAHPTDISVATA